jgi:hypothetical protein
MQATPLPRNLIIITHCDTGLSNNEQYQTKHMKLDVLMAVVINITVIQEGHDTAWVSTQVSILLLKF